MARFKTLRTQKQIKRFFSDKGFFWKGKRTINQFNRLVGTPADIYTKGLGSYKVRSKKTKGEFKTLNMKISFVKQRTRK